MKRRGAIKIAACSVAFGLSGCSSLNSPELRIRNFSEEDHEISVSIMDGDKAILSDVYSVPAKSDSEEQVEVEEVYPGPGAYTVSGSVDQGEKKSRTLRLDESTMTHVTVRGSGEISVGRITP